VRHTPTSTIHLGEPGAYTVVWKRMPAATTWKDTTRYTDSMWL